MSDKLDFHKKQYVVSPELDKLAQDVIANKSLLVSPARVKYVLVYPHINKKTAGRCILANTMVKLFGDCDYIIQMSGDLWDQLDDKRREILMWHELKHVLPIQNEKTGEWNFKLREHDVMEFFDIIKAEGIDWLSELKALHQSVYDLEPKDVDGFSL